jgi:hypothetical protein
VTWLPFCRARDQPARSKARTASSPEHAGSLAIDQYGQSDFDNRSARLGFYHNLGYFYLCREAQLSSGFQTRFDRFANIRESLGFGPTLRHAAGKGRAFYDDESSLVAFERD